MLEEKENIDHLKKYEESREEKCRREELLNAEGRNINRVNNIQKRKKKRYIRYLRVK